MAGLMFTLWIFWFETCNL